MIKRLKSINIYSRGTLLRLAKKRYYGNDGLNLAWDLGVIFLGVPN